MSKGSTYKLLLAHDATSPSHNAHLLCAFERSDWELQVYEVDSALESNPTYSIDRYFMH